MPLLVDLKKRTAIDRDNNVYSQIIQDERYLNWYFWKHANDTGLNIRILDSSYVYPFNPSGFGAYLTNHSRPIIVHGSAKFGKMLKGEVILRLQAKHVGGDNGICFDGGMYADKVGTYYCHKAEYKGGSQGYIWTKVNQDTAAEPTAREGRLRVAYNGYNGKQLCLDGAVAGVAQPLKVAQCQPVQDSRASQTWVLQDGGQLMNQLSKLCMDPMRFDHDMYPETQKDSKWPVTMQPCRQSPYQQIVLDFVDIEEADKAARRRMHDGREWGH